MSGAGQMGPIITFHAPGGRSFQRIFRDISFAETKEAVRLKLGLPAGEQIKLARIEGGVHYIDLDDDDDFDAFRIATRFKDAVEIAVIVGTSTRPSIPVGLAQPAAALPQWESASALAVPRKRKRHRISIVPGNEPIYSDIPATPHAKPAAAGALPSHVTIDHASPVLSTQMTGSDAAPPRKRRKKLKANNMLIDNRSASNPPVNYLPPTPDSLASGPSLPLTHDNEPAADAPAQASLPLIPEHAPPVHRVRWDDDKMTPGRMPSAISPADQGSSSVAPVKKRKADRGQNAAGGPAPLMFSLSKSIMHALGPGSEVKKPRSKKGREMEPEVVDNQEDVPMPTETPRKPKKEKCVKAVKQVDDQPAAAPAPKAAVGTPPVRAPAKEKSKKKRKDLEGVDHAEAPIMTNSAPEVPKADETFAVPVKTKSKKKRKTEAEPEHADVVLQPTVDASEMSEKRKSKKRQKEGEGAGEPGVQAKPKAVPVPSDAPTASSTGDKKGKKRKEADMESVKPAHAASASKTPAAAFDHQKAVADAVAAIRARYSKAAKPTVTESPARAPHPARDEPTPAPVAGPSTPAVDPPAKEKRKSKKADVTDASSQSVPPPAESAVTSKSKGKKRKTDCPAGESRAAPPSALSEAAMSEMWSAVKAAAFTLNKRASTLPTPHPATEQPTSAPLLGSEVTPEVVPDAPAKVEKLKKEKAVKSKPAVPDVIETADVEHAEDAPPKSTTTTSVTAVETLQPKKRKGKSRVRADPGATESEVDVAKDVDMVEDQLRKPPHEADTASHASSPLSPRSASQPLQDVEMSSPPRPPIGSDVDEVVIEEHGQGSSGESSSSSDTEDEDEDKEEDSVNAPLTDLSLVDIEALLRGPAPRKSILEVLPSDSEDEDGESDNEEQSEPGDDEEEELKRDKEYRRLSKRLPPESSSSDEEPEPEPEQRLELEPEHEPDVAQVEEELEVAAATFMDVDSQETVEAEVGPKVPPTVVQASQEVSVLNDDDVPMSAPADEEPLGPTQQFSPPPDRAQDPARPVSPTVSMLGEDRRRDDSQDISTRSLAQIEEQLSLKASIPDIDEASSPNPEDKEGTEATSPATFKEPESTSSITKRKPSSESIATAPGRELKDDLFEAADDLVVPESPRIDLADPIEPEPEPEPSASPANPERRQSTPPPLPVSRPGTVQRMKNRDGKLGTPRPVKASELPIAALVIPELAEFEFDFDVAPSPPQTQTKARVTRRTSATASMAPPQDPTTPTPAPAPVSPAPKRRGRPPLPPEEKERRAAERKAKKEAEKVEKARLREVRANKRPGRMVKAKMVDAETEEDERGAAQVEKEGKAPLEATPRPGWTTLTQEGSVVEGESMMIDELRSSSPASSPRQEELEHSPRTPASRAMPPPSIKTSKVQSGTEVGSQPETPAQAPNADPLFLPSSSQVPYTPYALAQPPSQSGATGDSSGESGSELDDEPITKTRLQHARPWLRDAPFRRLSDIASQALFTPSSAFALTPGVTKDATWGATQQGAANGQEDDDDDDDDDDSDDMDGAEEEGKKSHIPQERRAGAGVQKKRVSGLMSFAH